MFVGLEEENETDLCFKRLNAYRSHFDLPEMPESYESEYVVEQIIDAEDVTQIGGTEDYITENYEEEEHLDLLIEEDMENYDLKHDQFVIEEEVAVVAVEVDDTLEVEEEPLEKDPKIRYKCHICSAGEFPKMSLLTTHCQKYHDCMPQVECTCGKLLSTYRRLKIHRDKHFPSDSPFKCSICKIVLLTQQNFERHKQSHLLFCCNVCGKSFRDRKTFKFHEQTHEKPIEERRNFECEICNTRFVTKQACLNHISQQHERSSTFQCQSCPKAFHTRKNLREHMKNVHSERLFQCSKCDFKAKTNNALRSHMDVHLNVPSELMLTCDLCGIQSSTKRRLRSHFVVHMTATPYQCTRCPSAFKRKKDWANHENHHLNL